MVSIYVPLERNTRKPLGQGALQGYPCGFTALQDSSSNASSRGMVPKLGFETSLMGSHVAGTY